MSRTVPVTLYCVSGGYKDGGSRKTVRVGIACLRCWLCPGFVATYLNNPPEDGMAHMTVASGYVKAAYATFTHDVALAHISLLTPSSPPPSASISACKMLTSSSLAISTGHCRFILE